MGIKEITIRNFKCFNGDFHLTLHPSLNILVGDNESGKSTILQAIHLALSGYYCGNNIRKILTPYLFNKKAVDDYLKSLQKSESHLPPPEVIIQLVFNKEYPEFEGKNNLDKTNEISGITFKIAFDEKYKLEYRKLMEEGVYSLPLEYYSVSWTSFAGAKITTYSIPFKSVFIDSSTYHYQNGSDVYISRLVRDCLDEEDIMEIRRAHRLMIDEFSKNEIISQINDKISKSSNAIVHEVGLKANQGNINAWEKDVAMHVKEIPFMFIGKGKQCVLKTELALNHEKAQKAAIILIEEPESHLSYSNLNILIRAIQDKYDDKQILISTHSSFVANKLGLNNLILLRNHRTTKIKDLNAASYFAVLPGYDTLRYILCRKAILVEGASDELVVQRAYRDNHDGKLPIEDGIDVIAVQGLSFLRYLEIADKLHIKTAIVSDNDGDYEAVKRKYVDYLGDNKKEYVDICIDSNIDTGDLKIGNKQFNYNTLEPKLLKENSIQLFNDIFGKSYKNEEELFNYMQKNKTECALKIFNSSQKIKYPNYIMKAVKSDE